MAIENDPNDIERQSDKPAENKLKFSWRLLLLACALILLSLIDKWRLTETLTLSGGVTLAALAAVVLLWPVVQQIMVRGGEVDLKYLRLKVNQIENETQRMEQDNAMRIQELESEMSDFRSGTLLAAKEGGRIAKLQSSTTDDDASVLQWARDAYATAAPMQDFRKRIEIDREIVKRGRHLSFSALNGFLESQSWSPEAQMAAAVALGLSPPKKEETERARLLADLIASGHERVRARAGQAAKRWGERRTTSKESRSILLSACEIRLPEESPTSGARAYLEKALEVLSATRNWGEQ